MEKAKKPQSGNYLYFLTLTPDIYSSMRGVFFKIGVTDDTEACLEPYQNDLPFNPLYRKIKAPPLQGVVL
ncbi:MAG: hypothetical protein FWG66_04905 [Spirochaetes bacterium]|nr:hypothetical protein [Spirochaetota bacterium]